MLVNKYTKGAFLVFGMSDSTAQAYTGSSAGGCNGDDLFYTTTSGFANRLIFCTEQPINIDDLLATTTMTNVCSGGTSTGDEADETSCTDVGGTWSLPLSNGSVELLEFSLTSSTDSSNSSESMPKITFETNDGNKNPLTTGTAKWFLMMKDDIVICMGEVTDMDGTGDIKLSKVNMVPEDEFRFYRLVLEASADQIFTNGLITA